MIVHHFQEIEIIFFEMGQMGIDGRLAGNLRRREMMPETDGIAVRLLPPQHGFNPLSFVHHLRKCR